MLCIPKLFYLVVGITFVIYQSEIIVTLLLCSFCRKGKKVFLLKPAQMKTYSGINMNRGETEARQLTLGSEINTPKHAGWECLRVRQGSESNGLRFTNSLIYHTDQLMHSTLGCIGGISTRTHRTTSKGRGM